MSVQGDLLATLQSPHIQHHSYEAVQIEMHSEKGRILVATRDIKKGEAIMVEEMLHMVVAPSDQSKIWQMIKKASEESHSEICLPMWIWSALCSSVILLNHEIEGVDSDKFREVQQRITKYYDIPNIDPVVQEKLLLLMVHDNATEATDTKYLHLLLQLIKMDLHDVFPNEELIDVVIDNTFDITIMARLILVWIFNCFEFDTEPETHVTYFISSFLSHSCLPNAICNTEEDDSAQVVRARMDVNKGEELTISYVTDDALFLPTIARRHQMLLTKNFYCNCDRCLYPSDTCRIMQCPKCEDGYILLRNTHGWNNDYYWDLYPFNVESVSLLDTCYLTQAMVQSGDDRLTLEAYPRAVKWFNDMDPQQWPVVERKVEVQKGLKDLSNMIGMELMVANHALCDKFGREPGKPHRIADNRQEYFERIRQIDPYATPDRCIKCRYKLAEDEVLIYLRRERHLMFLGAVLSEDILGLDGWDELVDGLPDWKEAFPESCRIPGIALIKSCSQELVTEYEARRLYAEIKELMKIALTVMPMSSATYCLITGLSHCPWVVDAPVKNAINEYKASICELLNPQQTGTYYWALESSSNSKILLLNPKNRYAAELEHTTMRRIYEDAMMTYAFVYESLSILFGKNSQITQLQSRIEMSKKLKEIIFGHQMESVT